MFSSEQLTDQQIRDYAQSLAGGVPLTEIPAAPGRFYAKLADGSTINLRNVSKSAEETQARWTIEIVNNKPLLNKIGKSSIDKIEIKLR